MSDRNPVSKRGRHRRKYLLLLILVILLLCAGILCYRLLYLPSNQDGVAGGKREADALKGSLHTMTDDEIQEELDRIVEEGMFRISIASNIMAIEDDVAEVRIENNQTNRYLMKTQIYLDETGEEIYGTDLIDPGYYIQETVFDRHLDPGEYAATAIFTAFYPDTEEIVGTAGAQVTIRVFERGTDLEALQEAMTETETSEANDAAEMAESNRKNDSAGLITKGFNDISDLTEASLKTDVYLQVTSDEQESESVTERADSKTNSKADSKADLSPDSKADSKADKASAGQTVADWFLVYDKNYHPADFILTECQFDEEDLMQQEAERDASFALRVQQYFDAHPNAILVTTILEDQPTLQEEQKNQSELQEGQKTPLAVSQDEKNQPDPETDETIAYGQRSLMPSGALLQDWEKNGYEKLGFMNDDMGLLLDLSALHTDAIREVYSSWLRESDPEYPVSDEMIDQMFRESVFEFCVAPICPDAEKQIPAVAEHGWYRITCRIHYEEREEDVTNRIEDMAYLWKTDELLWNEELPREQQYNFMIVEDSDSETDEDGRFTDDSIKREAAQLNQFSSGFCASTEYTDSESKTQVSPEHTDSEPEIQASSEYTAGEPETQASPQYTSNIPETKQFHAYTVDVQKEEAEIENSSKIAYHSYTTEENVLFADGAVLTAPAMDRGLVGLEKIQTDK